MTLFHFGSRYFEILTEASSCRAALRQQTVLWSLNVKRLPVMTARTWTFQVWVWCSRPMSIRCHLSGLATMSLIHWGRVTHICVNKLTIIGSDNVLSPGRRQAIIWTNAGILLIGNLGTNCSEILIESRPFSFKKMHLKMSSGKRRPFCLGLNVLIGILQGPLSFRYFQTNKQRFYSHWVTLTKRLARSITSATLNCHQHYYRWNNFQWIEVGH